MFNGNVVKRQDHYRHVGFGFHATKNLALWVSHLVSAAKLYMQCADGVPTCTYKTIDSSASCLTL